METNAVDRLRELRARDSLEASYDTVAGLLARSEAEDDPVALRRAGRLLAGVDPRRVLECHPGTPVVTVAITGQSTVAPVVDPLTAELARHGILLRPVLGDHGAYVHDLTDREGHLHGVGQDLTLCLLDAETVFARVPEVWRPEDVARAADETLALLADVAAAHTAASGSPLVLNTVPLLRSWSHQLVDHRSRAALGAVWRDFNSGLLRLSGTTPGLVVIDLDPLLAEGGPVHDVRLAHYAGARLGAPLLAAYAREVAHLVRALRGKTRKCLVLDLDQTLWDGVLAEEGADGIAAAGTDRGEAFGAFQRVVKQLASQGVLLAVSTRNDRGRRWPPSATIRTCGCATPTSYGSRPTGTRRTGICSTSRNTWASVPTRSCSWTTPPRSAHAYGAACPRRPSYDSTTSRRSMRPGCCATAGSTVRA